MFFFEMLYMLFKRYKWCDVIGAVLFAYSGGCRFEQTAFRMCLLPGNQASKKIFFTAAAVIHRSSLVSLGFFWASGGGANRIQQMRVGGQEKG